MTPTHRAASTLLAQWFCASARRVSMYIYTVLIVFDCAPIGSLVRPHGPSIKNVGIPNAMQSTLGCVHRCWPRPATVLHGQGCSVTETCSGACLYLEPKPSTGVGTSRALPPLPPPPPPSPLDGEVHCTYQQHLHPSALPVQLAQMLVSCELESQVSQHGLPLQ